MTRAALVEGRRRGAVALFRLAGAVLRGATALYFRRTISARQMRAALAAVSCLERTGALLALGRLPPSAPRSVEKERTNDCVD